MCGRFTLTTEDLASLAKEWGAEVEDGLRAGWRPRFNVAPGDRHPLLIVAAGATGGRRLISATFGWRGAGEGGGFLVNARAETAATLPTFRDAYRARRAAVPADGFYEWQGPPTARRPTWFHDRGRPMLLAGLLGEAPGGGPGFVILTTEARAPVRALHDRMPLLIPASLVDAWLSPCRLGTDAPAGDPGAERFACQPPVLPAPADGALEARAVSERVNSIRNDDAACIAPAAPPAQGSLF
jgi:putative SOS response-associated peptidase YedK